MLGEPCLVGQHDIFCLAPAYRQISEVTGFLREVGPDGEDVVIDPARTEALGVRVEMVALDASSQVANQALRQVCRDSLCVVYRVSCETLTCSWEAAWPGDGEVHLSRLTLTATSAEALDRARANIFVRAQSDSDVIPLEELSEAGGEPPVSGAYFGHRFEPFQ